MSDVSSKAYNHPSDDPMSVKMAIGANMGLRKEKLNVEGAVTDSLSEMREAVEGLKEISMALFGTMTPPLEELQVGDPYNLGDKANELYRLVNDLRLSIWQIKTSI